MTTKKAKTKTVATEKEVTQVEEQKVDVIETFIAIEEDVSVQNTKQTNSDTDTVKLDEDVEKTERPLIPHEITGKPVYETAEEFFKAQETKGE